MPTPVLPVDLLLNLLTSAVFVFMTYAAATALLRSHGDTETTEFVVASYGCMLLLFFCLREFDRLQANDHGTPPAGAAAKKERLKLAVWALGTALNFLFAHRVSCILASSAAMCWFAWGVSGVTTVVGFAILFWCPGRPLAVLRDGQNTGISVQVKEGRVASYM